MEHGAVDDRLNRINKDTIKVYCTGDLIDGHYNREGDLMLLAFAEEWFDAVAIGNHEWAFCGGQDFGGCRKRDRELILGINQLIEKGVYVPSFVVENFLCVHAGLAARWGFETAEAANDAIHFMWDMSKSEDDEVPMFDWIGPERAGKWADETGGIFWLDWDEVRNSKINQIVGHTTFPSGPHFIDYKKMGTIHWNIDVGGKTGLCLGGVVIENGHAEPFFWGQRFRFQATATPEESEQASDESGEETSEEATNRYESDLERIAERVLSAIGANPEEGEAPTQAKAVEEAHEELDEAYFTALMEEPSHYNYLSLVDEGRD